MGVAKETHRTKRNLFEIPSHRCDEEIKKEHSKTTRASGKRRDVTSSLFLFCFSQIPPPAKTEVASE